MTESHMTHRPHIGHHDDVTLRHSASVSDVSGPRPDPERVTGKTNLPKASFLAKNISIVGVQCVHLM